MVEWLNERNEAAVPGSGSGSRTRKRRLSLSLSYYPEPNLSVAAHMSSYALFADPSASRSSQPSREAFVVPGTHHSTAQSCHAAGCQMFSTVVLYIAHRIACTLILYTIPRAEILPSCSPSCWSASIVTSLSAKETGCLARSRTRDARLLELSMLFSRSTEFTTRYGICLGSFTFSDAVLSFLLSRDLIPISACQGSGI
jgi:hypothetical protein